MTHASCDNVYDAFVNSLFFYYNPWMPFLFVRSFFFIWKQQTNQIHPTCDYLNLMLKPFCNLDVIRIRNKKSFALHVYAILEIIKWNILKAAWSDFVSNFQYTFKWHTFVFPYWNYFNYFEYFYLERKPVLLM